MIDTNTMKIEELEAGKVYENVLDLIKRLEEVTGKTAFLELHADMSGSIHIEDDDQEYTFEDEHDLKQTIKKVIRNKTDKLETTEFVDLMQNYRAAGMGTQIIVVKRFEDVKTWIKENFEPKGE